MTVAAGAISMVMRLVHPILILTFLCGFGCDRPLTFDAQGVAHGSGEKIYNYASGAPKLRETYVDGQVVRSRWYALDGKLIHESKWIDGTGEGIYLREDGSIRIRMPYVKGLAEGDAVQYDSAGNVTGVVTYRAGSPVSDIGRPATRPAG